MTQPSHPPLDPLTRIFAYRTIDLRDRFTQPLESFREALECLQSDRSYMAAMSGDIITYLSGDIITYLSGGCTSSRDL